MRTLLAALFLAAVALFGIPSGAQETGSAQKPEASKSEPKYDDTFSGPIVELSTEKLTVSRSILGKPAERRTFWIKSDTRIEGKLRLHAKVTVGFTTADGGDVARLIVVRTAQKPANKK